jgi:hypothetical protein
MLTSHRLPFHFDPVPLHADLARVRPDEWVAHFNTQEYEGDWSGVSLRSVGGAPGAIYPDPTTDAAFADTPVLGRCPSFQAVLAQFHCPLRSVRLLRLGGGSRIREHRDYKLGYEDGEVRIHIPVTTNPEVDFFVNARKLRMEVGESWYINFNLPHRVVNRGSTPRIHLVVDCVVNDWLRGLLPEEITATTSDPDPAPPAAVENLVRSPEALTRFRRLVHEDSFLQEELCDIADRQLFMERVLQLGAQRGCCFSAADVEEEVRASRRAWLERWIQ